MYKRIVTRMLLNNDSTCSPSMCRLHEEAVFYPARDTEGSCRWPQVSADHTFQGFEIATEPCLWRSRIDCRDLTWLPSLLTTRQAYLHRQNRWHRSGSCRQIFFKSRDINHERLNWSSRSCPAFRRRQRIENNVALEIDFWRERDAEPHRI